MTRPAPRPPAALRRIACLAVASTALAGCGFSGVQDLPLPGGADLGDHPYTVKAQFANVLNLVPQSAVKVNDVAVGRVVKVSLPREGWTAEVTMKVDDDVKLPANACAELRQSSLLGEKFVQLSAGPTNVPGGAAAPGGAPPGGDAPSAGTGTLADGAVIPVSRTNRNPEVEEVFGALSMLLNGGGIAQLRTITGELNRALGGNEPQVRSLLEQARRLVGDLDANKKGITDAIDGLNRLSATLRGRKAQIGVALDDIEPGLAVLEEQRGALVRMLASLDELSRVAVTTVRRSKDDLIADLQALEPTLRKLSDAGHDLPDALQVLLTYPFTDAVLPAVKGDYLNVYLQVTARPGTQVIPPIAPPQGD
ncbi:MlaD family protein [Actinomadura bangladeshensis]|uniref:MCE family protein n=1 Tax=Actinomadura bangladeshensis TaxID=453573 RepID=A0A4R4NEE1_9ACTN|nr:MlaD family protein [Actinomadura bangladeshensis]TDC07501.1 MCE family protein [Actinomadura bangladeshensis]